jgi:hypothetical protein
MSTAEGLSPFVGAYKGDGRWIDVTGESKAYRVAQEMSLRPSGLLIAYAHEFFEEDASRSGTFELTATPSSLLTVHMNGTQVGFGYLFASYLHYYVQVGDAFVEVSYEIDGQKIHVRGSSTRNARGRFIAWHESLKTVANHAGAS